MDRDALAVMPEAGPGPEAGASTAAKGGSSFRALRSQPFRLYFGGQVVSASGSFLQQTAIGWLVLERTGSPGDLGLVLAAGGIPSLLFGPWGGAVAEGARHRVEIRVTLAGTASLLLRDELEGSGAKAPFVVESYRVIIDRREDGALVSEATVKVIADGLRVISTEEGNGPVNALDRALRAALTVAYPRLADFELTDYKVRILQGKLGTDAVTRVLVQTSDGRREWTTVGVDSNVVQASWLAMVDAVRYGLLDR